MAQDGKHIPSKEFKDNYDFIFRRKKKTKKKLNNCKNRKYQVSNQKNNTVANTGKIEYFLQPKQILFNKE